MRIQLQHKYPCTVVKEQLTIRGPELKGVNIMGFEVIIPIRFESNHLSGSNLSASGPQRSGFRCINIGIYIIGVDPGMYKGSVGVGMNTPEGLNFDGCDGGSVTGAGLDSRTLRGTGGKRRSVSFKTARTRVALS